MCLGMCEIVILGLISGWPFASSPSSFLIVFAINFTSSFAWNCILRSPFSRSLLLMIVAFIFLLYRVSLTEFSTVELLVTIEGFSLMRTEFPPTELLLVMMVGWE